ncbi:YheC/D like ATP-grasp [Evansella caseinilytica]|uniref:YheC/D like ATP-grasp n=1 Tax=Evansella caseinilytica TaxID=1503961 RepID=A0A1H3JZ98_9BACI|nr:YheC/YheD family protein [Evansella caseinilytica]SDY45242.1 YheC/D like ATP-grasp [Evansella caseinilytica]
MHTLGILQLNTEQESEYLNQIAEICMKNNIQVFRFTPFAFHAAKGIVTGLKYASKEKNWIPSTFALPKYIYDRCFYPDNQSFRKYILNYMKQLKERAIFLNKGLPNKWTVYTWLFENAEIRKHLPPTQRLTKESLEAYLKTFRKVVVKPIFGSGGNGLYFIELSGKKSLISRGDSPFPFHQAATGTSLYTAVREITGDTPYLVQKFLPLQIDGYPFDLRVIMQKKSRTDWRIVGKGFRMGKKGTVVSNLHAGGKIAANIPFKKQASRRLQAILNKLIPGIPTQLEKFHQPLFEIGIDFGLCQTGEVWLLEVNSKPGYQTVLETSSLRKQPIAFSGPLEMINIFESSIPAAGALTL